MMKKYCLSRSWILTLDLSPSRAGQHIGQCISSNHLCPPLRREHLPIFAGLCGWSPANFSSVFLFPLFAPESSSSLVWLFYSFSFWPNDPTTSAFSFCVKGVINKRRLD